MEIGIIQLGEVPQCIHISIIIIVYKSSIGFIASYKFSLYGNNQIWPIIESMKCLK